MLSHLARLAVLGAFAATATACSNGNGNALGFAGPPNNAGGSSGTFQSGGSGTALLRFIQGSPDYGKVDVCVDNLPFSLTTLTAVQYGGTTGLYAVTGGIAHTVSIYPTLGPGQIGLECPTAPGPYLGTNTIAITTISPGASARQTIVLGGRNAGGTLGLYVFGEPSFTTTPPMEAISHNAAPFFSAGKAFGVGFGTCSTTVTPCTVPSALAGAQGIAAPTKSAPNASVLNSSVTSALAAVPAGFYDGIGVAAAGTPVPITSVAALALVASQPYVIQLYALDAPAGGLNLLSVYEQTAGYGF